MLNPTENHHPDWLAWSQQLQAIAQTGLSFSKNPFDVQRYEKVRQVSAEIMASRSTSPMDRILMVFESQAGYATPKVSVRSAVFRGETILLVKELLDGCWTLPGGWIDINETPGQAAEREVMEEAGYRVRVRRLLAVYDNHRHGHPPYPFHVFNFFFDCELEDGESAVPIICPGNVETGESGFFSLPEIPPLSTNRTTLPEIQAMFALHADPALPTDFD